jgi:hypothetical protein
MTSSASSGFLPGAWRSTVLRSLTAFNVHSAAPGAPRWSLDDVGLSREAALAHCMMRACRWDEWGAVNWLGNVLSGHTDPEAPALLPETLEMGPCWIMIWPDGKPLPPVPEHGE